MNSSLSTCLTAFLILLMLLCPSASLRLIRQLQQQSATTAHNISLHHSTDALQPAYHSHENSRVVAASPASASTSSVGPPLELSPTITLFFMKDVVITPDRQTSPCIDMVVRTNMFAIRKLQFVINNYWVDQNSDGVVGHDCWRSGTYLSLHHHWQPPSCPVIDVRKTIVASSSTCTRHDVQWTGC
jgi:hypothetical protein